MAFLNTGKNKKEDNNEKSRSVKQYRRGINRGAVLVFIIVAAIGLLFIKDSSGKNLIEKFSSGGSESHAVLSKKEAGQIKVLIDAGHGGFDNGAKSDYTDKSESELNLQMSNALKEQMESVGFQVEMTRNDSNALGSTKNEDMKNRQDMIYKSDADIVLSVHMNTHQDRSVNGPIVFFMPGSVKGKTLADDIQASMNEELKPKNPKSTQSQNFLVLRSGNMPCVLIECGFLTNKEEGTNLGKSAYQKRVAQSVTWGIMDYFAKES